MLKWTSMQKLPETLSTPRILNNTSNHKNPINRKRRATINITSNKENIITSTPVVKKCGNSPLLLEEFLALTPPAKILRNTSKTCSVKIQYASTLPKFAEEYSPNILCPGQMVAMRGLLPDSYIGNPRYLTKTPKQELSDSGEKFSEKPLRKILTRKRKLEMDFNKCENYDEKDKTTTLNSSKMGDITLDKLIDAILDSTKKDKNKRKTPRKSLNLRRRTLLKNSTNIDLILSPSYKPADDPCSDLSFSELKRIDVPPELKSDEIKSNSKRKLSLEDDEKNYPSSNSKKSRRSSNSRKYFEVGLALPSIYV